MTDLHSSHTLGDTGQLEHLKIKTRLIEERFPSVMGQCVLDDRGSLSILRLIRSVTSLTRMLPTIDLRCDESVSRRKWNSPLINSVYVFYYEKIERDLNCLFIMKE
jgi:hypothetical protein